MVRKIGNIFLIFCIGIFSMHYIGAEPIAVEMRLLDEQGIMITKTGTGIPIVLEIIVRGTSSGASKIYIGGLKDVDVEQQGTTKQVSTVNGVSSTKTVYRYMIRAKKEGIYTIGPAQVHLESATYNSQTHELEVQDAYRQSCTNQKVSLEVKVDKQHVMVGERVPLSIRFYKDKKCELLGIDPLELQDCKMNPLQGPYTAVAQRNGMQQKYIEWKTMVVAKKAGEFIIPALKAYYKEPTDHAGLHPVLLGGLFDFGYTKKALYSEPVHFYVEPLPVYEGNVHAVGLFTSFQAKLNQHEAKKGEGIVLSLELEGDGDFDHLVHPILQLPESLTYYDSRTTVSGKKKIFEYIVQGKKEGSWEIPSQEFVFFDVEDKTYKTLQTTALPLNITVNFQNNKQPLAKDIQKQDREKVPNIWPLQEKYQSEQDKSEFPSYILWLGFIGPILLGLIRDSRSIIAWYTTRNILVSRKKTSFNRARKRIKIASKTCNTQELYDIFVSFIVDWQGIEQAEISQDIIRQKLVRFSESVVAQWDIFFSKITAQAYSNSSLTLQEKEELFKSACMWLTLFQKSESL